MGNKKNLGKIFLYTFLLILAVIAAGILYSYFKGGSSNYTPPEIENQSDQNRVVNDLITISGAVESYYSINFTYPDSLNKLIPDFINEIPKEPVTGVLYSYSVVNDTAYEIKYSRPDHFRLKELKARNGKIIKE